MRIVGRRNGRSAATVAMALVLALLGRPTHAGPPYISDDPEPTDYGHFEIYGFTLGTATRGSTMGQAGIDFNYGALPDLQVTVVLPAAFSQATGENLQLGLGNIQFAAKYRFLHQESFGLDVSFFPRLFMPAGTSAVGNANPSLLLPLWLQKDWGKWSLFGGGGCAISTDPGQGFCQAGAVVTRQVLPELQLGLEAAWQSANAEGTPQTTGIGLGARYDLSEHAHLLAYINRGVQNADATNDFSWYTAMLVTF
jgi:Putative MetA-pathway of phenol degradation